MSCPEGMALPQTHDNFPKDFKIITGKEHSGERGYVTLKLF
jgi:hypothetical protein